MDEAQADRAAHAAPRRNGYDRIIAGFLSVVTATLLVLVVVGVFRLDTLTSRAFSNLKETALWPASQTTIELAEFLLRLDDFDEGRSGGDRRALTDKFDILVSRKVLYDSGELARLVRTDPAMRATVERLAGAIGAIEPLLARVDRPGHPDIAAIRALAAPLMTPARNLMLAGLMHDLSEYDRQLSAYLVQRNQMQILGGLCAAALLGFVLYLILSAARIRRLLDRTAQIGATLEDVLESMGEGLIVWDRENRLVMTNRRWHDLFPAASAEARPGVPIEVVVECQLRALAAAGLKESHGDLLAYKNRIVTDLDHAQLMPSETGRWIVATNRRMQNGYTVGIRTDISELITRERDLAAARQRLTDVIENIGEGFLLWDADRRLVLVNRIAKGYFPGEPAPFRIGEPIEDTLVRIAGIGRPPVAPEAVARRAGRWIARLVNGRPLEYRLPDGRWLLISTSLLKDGSLAMVAADVSLLREREQEAREARLRLLRQTEEMRSLADAAQNANRAKSAFLAAMSHEIRTPLNAVVGFTDLLAEAGLPPTQHGYAELIGQSARHLVAIVNDILDFSRLEAGRLTLEPTEFEPHRLLHDLVGIARSLARGKPIAVGLTVDPALPERLTGDALRINQVLLNLVSNAVKFTAAGEVHITARLAAEAPDRVRVRFVVDDTGPGLPESARRWLFAAFEQGEATGAVRAAGTGLGLAISKSLVRLMDGEIDFEPGAAGGSRFHFEVPLARAPAGAAAAPGPVPPAAEPASAPAGLAVLVAEDTPASQMLIRLLLEARGHRVTCVDDGAAAVEAAAAGGFDLILLDLRMPRLDGVEAARAIRALPGRAASVPIVALTAQIGDAEREAAAGAGMTGYLTKPFRAGELDAVLAAARPAA